MERYSSPSNISEDGTIQQMAESAEVNRVSDGNGTQTTTTDTSVTSQSSEISASPVNPRKSDPMMQQIVSDLRSLAQARSDEYDGDTDRLPILSELHAKAFHCRPPSSPTTLEQHVESQSPIEDYISDGDDIASVVSNENYEGQDHPDIALGHRTDNRSNAASTVMTESIQDGLAVDGSQSVTIQPRDNSIHTESKIDIVGALTSNDPNPNVTSKADPTKTLPGLSLRNTLSSDSDNHGLKTLEQCADQRVTTTPDVSRPDTVQRSRVETQQMDIVSQFNFLDQELMQSSPVRLPMMISDARKATRISDLCNEPQKLTSEGRLGVRATSVVDLDPESRPTEPVIQDNKIQCPNSEDVMVSEKSAKPVASLKEAAKVLQITVNSDRSVGERTSEISTAPSVHKPQHKSKFDDVGDYLDTTETQKTRRKPKPIEKPLCQFKQSQPARTIKIEDIMQSPPSKYLKPSTKRPNPTINDSGFSNPAMKKPRTESNSRSQPRSGVVMPTPETIDLSGSDNEIEKLVIAKYILEETRNSFPRFQTGDVYLAFGDDQAWRLHSSILGLVSPWFRDALKPTPKEGLKYSLAEHNDGLAKNVKNLNKLKFRFDLYARNGTRRLLRSTFTDLCDVPKGTNAGLSSNHSTKLSAARPKDIRHRCDTRPNASHRFQNVKLAMGTNAESGLRHVSNRKNQDRLFPLFEAHDNLFRVYYSLPVNLSQSCILKALEQAEALLQVAEGYGSLHQTAPHIKASLMNFGRVVYRAVAQDPRRWLNISITLESAPIFKESVTHIIGNYPEYQASTIDAEGLPAVVHNLLIAKLHAFKETKDKIDQSLLESSITMAGNTLRFLKLEESQCNTWLIVRCWQDWFAEALAEANTAREAGSLDASMYRLMAEGCDAYLDIDRVYEKIERFRCRKLTVEEEVDVLQDMALLKRFAMNEVKPLTVNHSMLPIAEEGISHFTCVEVLDHELPWNQVKRMKEED